MARFPMHTFQQDAILARLSDALVALEVSDIKSLTNEQCEKLQCGDIVVKKTGEQEHAYVVSYKEKYVGMCLTYTDASVVETQSYDWDVEDGWIYNSEDKTPNLLNVATKNEIESGALENAKPIYYHGLDIYKSGYNSIQVHVLNNSNESINTLAKFKAWAEGITGQVDIQVNGAVNIDGTVVSPYLLRKNSSNEYAFYYPNPDTTSLASYLSKSINLEDYFVNVNDSVNKIN